MPSCTTCGVYYRGRGSRCGLHQRHTNTWLQGRHHNNYSSDSTDPSGIRPRSSGHGHRQSTLRFAIDNDDAYHNIDSNALIHYNTTTTATKPLSLAHPLIQAFATLTPIHAIASITYTVHPTTGTHSLTASANPERSQCSVCSQWFADESKLAHHQWELPVGCEECGICLREEDVGWHGAGVRHERCFVRGCGSHYRREGGWKSGVIGRHVREWYA